MSLNTFSYISLFLFVFYDKGMAYFSQVLNSVMFQFFTVYFILLRLQHCKPSIYKATLSDKQKNTHAGDRETTHNVMQYIHINKSANKPFESSNTIFQKSYFSTVTQQPTINMHCNNITMIVILFIPISKNKPVRIISIRKIIPTCLRGIIKHLEDGSLNLCTYPQMSPLISVLII